MKQLISLTGAAIVALSTSASAATFDIVGGTAGIIPGAGQTNEVLTNVFGQSDALGIYGAQIGIILDAGETDAELEVAYMGYEAGFTNAFELTGDSVVSFSTIGGSGGEYAADPFTPLALDTTNVGAGLLNFIFTTDGRGGSIAPAVNGSNPDNGIPDESNFFTAFSRGSKDTIFLFFDDTGAGDDDNHDDFVVRLSLASGNGTTPQPVPLPAGGLLLLGGLGALAIARRRKTAA